MGQRWVERRLLLLVLLAFSLVKLVSAQISVDSVSLTYSSASPVVNQFYTCGYTASNDAGATVSYSWIVAGFPQAVTTAFNYPSSTSGISKGMTMTCTVTLTPTSGSPVSRTSNTITFANTAPEITGTPAIVPTSPRAVDRVNCTLDAGAVSDIDDTAAPAFNYTWLRNGATIMEFNDHLFASSFQRGDTIQCSMKPFDGTDYGLAVLSSIANISNSAPSITDLTVSPLNANTTSTLACEIGSIVDFDGDSLFSYTYQWSVDGNVVPAVTTQNLPSTYTNKSSQVTCTATPSDPYDTGSAFTSSPITILNSAPSVTSTSITPTAPTTTENATCVINSVRDDDPSDTTFTYVWQWTIDNVIVTGTTSDTLDSQLYVKGNVLGCSVAATDSEGAQGPYSNEVTVTVANSAPSMESVTMTLDSYTTPTVATCVAGTIYDPDGDSILAGLTYTWYSNGQVLTGETSNTLTTFTLDTSVSCSIIASDSSLSAPPVYSQALNMTAPTIASVTVADPQNSDSIFGDNDEITIVFDLATDLTVSSGLGDTIGAVLNKTRVDQLFTFSHSLGQDYSGQWTSNSEFLITIIDSRGNGNPLIVLTITPNSDAAILLQSGTSLRAHATSPVMTGSAGTAPLGFGFGSITTVSSLNSSDVGYTAITEAGGGLNHMIVVAGNTLYGIGTNDDGQLGLGTTTSFSSFTKVTVEHLSVTVSVSQAAAGDIHSVVLDTNGYAYFSGTNSNGQLGSSALTTLTEFVRYGVTYSGSEVLFHLVAAGPSFTILVGTGGEVYATGQHFGSTYIENTDHTDLLTQRVEVLLGMDIIDVQAGASHVLFLLSNGTVYCWGKNAQGQCGLSASFYSLPTKVETGSLAGANIKIIAAGSYHSLAADIDGAAHCFGKNADGQCGLPNGGSFVTTPTKLDAAYYNNTYISDVSAYADHSFIGSFDGSVFGFGWNLNDILGLDSTTEYYTRPTRVRRFTSLVEKTYASGDLTLSLVITATSSCLFGCSSHGSCYDGVCYCGDSWEGSGCETPICASAYGQQCSGNGTCTVVNNLATCICNTYFTGDACNLPDCAYTCDQGTCEFQTVSTKPSSGNRHSHSLSYSDGLPSEYFSVFPDLDFIHHHEPTDRHAKTLALIPACQCNTGYGGLNCSSCETGWTGGSCDVLDCSMFNDCSGHGNCTASGSTSACVCDDGYLGDSCSAPYCSGSPVCSGNGNCLTGTDSNGTAYSTCDCNLRWSGDNCETASCLTSVDGEVCSGHGTCVEGTLPTCSCDDDWSTEDCSQPLCSQWNDCNGHGTCVDDGGSPSCDCDDSWEGDACDSQLSFFETLHWAVIAAVIAMCLAIAIALVWAGYKFWKNNCSNDVETADNDKLANVGGTRFGHTNFFDPTAPRIKVTAYAAGQGNVYGSNGWAGV